MTNEEHVALLKQGVGVWNQWRRENPDIRPDLFKADLRETDLNGADLHDAILINADLREAHLGGADLRKADLGGAHLYKAILCEADLREATLNGADLFKTDLSEALLHKAILSGANLFQTILLKADLREANLLHAALIEADLTTADLTGCRIYGASAWGVTLDETTQQKNLVITDRGEPEITVDNIEVAQFIYLLLHNQKIRDVIDTITSKVVLILGRFTEERKNVLDALRKELRQRKYVPIMFDFDKSRNQTTDETITLLARMARFVIADISDAKSVLQELRAIVPDLPSVPVQPLILHSHEEPGMFDFFSPRLRPSVLETHRYDDLDELIADLGERVISPAEAKVQELRGPVP